MQVLQLYSGPLGKDSCGGAGKLIQTLLLSGILMPTQWEFV